MSDGKKYLSLSEFHEIDLYYLSKMNTQILSNLYTTVTGVAPESIIALSAAGSNRLYFRLISPNNSLIGVVGTSKDENKAFVTMANHFGANSLAVPKVLAWAPDFSCYIQEDLGDVLLFDHLALSRKNCVFTAHDVDLLSKAMSYLVDIQIKGDVGLDYSICYSQPAFDERMVKWDLNYFKYDFLKLSGLEFREDLLENDFEVLSADLLQCKYLGFMYRDFQSRNVMVIDNDLKFIDFQGGRRGPLAYDLASFLWQAKAAYPDSLKQQLIQVYLDSLRKYIAVDENDFRKELELMVFFRLLQVLGAYGFRGLIEKKQAFAESIPYALASLRKLTPSYGDKYPYLHQLVLELSQIERYQPIATREKLLIKVYSFSYKKGIPEDYSGNGGGFVFDCRAIHNPGKYTEYKKLTGLDQPVQKFLEEDGEIFHFLENVNSLLTPSVERYLKRGFTDLMISFGCTGGQHRSVYSAQKTAEYLHRTYGVEVELIHREQHIRAFLGNSQLQK